jgi:Rps23 Pro-64 3,4-dihydroxylase Tpa1-like proline 4-hydroxylase
MSTSSESTTQLFQFDREQLGALAERHRESYASGTPYPHIVMDDFLPEEVLDEILTEFPDPRGADWFAFDSPNERKLATKDDSTMGPATRRLLAELNSSAFVDFLERLTGIEGLIPDPHFVGGGLHQIESGGHLKVHADFNRHPRTELERRLNVLIYLNRDWKDEYGGAFELWDENMTAAVEKVMPYFNRCVVFSTTSTSFHGHPEPLTCPPDRTRKSIALYYYSKTRPATEQGEAHNTLFQARPGEELPEPVAAPRPTAAEGAKKGLRMLTPPIVLEARRRMRERRRP